MGAWRFSALTCSYQGSLIQKTGHFAETILFGKDADYYRRLTESGMKIAYCDLDSLIYRRYARNIVNYQSSYGKLALELIFRKRTRFRDK